MRALILVLLLTGCATTAGYKRKLDTWLGESIERLVQQAGAPNRIMDISDSLKAYEYSGGYTTHHAYSVGYGMAYGQSHYHGCTTTFMVRNGTIESYTFQGSQCTAH